MFAIWEIIVKIEVSPAEAAPSLAGTYTVPWGTKITVSDDGKTLTIADSEKTYAELSAVPETEAMKAKYKDGTWSVSPELGADGVTGPVT